jgi:hypothetical protein
MPPRYLLTRTENRLVLSSSLFDAATASRVDPLQSCANTPCHDCRGCPNALPTREPAPLTSVRALRGKKPGPPSGPGRRRRRRSNPPLRRRGMRRAYTGSGPKVSVLGDFQGCHMISLYSRLQCRAIHHTLVLGKSHVTVTVHTKIWPYMSKFAKVYISTR